MLRTVASALIAFYLASALASSSCKRKEAEPVPTQPPPVALGKCIVSRWVGSLPIDQACVWTGYSWHCVGTGAGVICDREAETAEVAPK